MLSLTWLMRNLKLRPLQKENNRYTKVSNLNQKRKQPQRRREAKHHKQRKMRIQIALILALVLAWIVDQSMKVISLTPIVLVVQVVIILNRKERIERVRKRVMFKEYQGNSNVRDIMAQEIQRLGSNNLKAKLNYISYLIREMRSD